MPSVFNVSISLTSGGGVAQLMRHYQCFLPDFHHISTTSDSNSKIVKLAYFLVAIVRIIIHCIFVKNIFHFHGASFTSYRRKYILSRIVHLLGGKTIFHLHGGDFASFHQHVGTEYLSKTLNNYDVVVVLSEYWRKYLQTRLGCNRVYVINNVVESPRELISKKVVDENFFNILYMGALYKDKGIYDIISVVKNNAADYQGRICIHICGGGSDKEISDFSNAVRMSGFSSEIVYHGWVDGKRKCAFLQQCDALILPSYYEGLPMCILEAMSYGKPILASNVGSIPEIVRHGVNGYLFEPGRIDLMGEYIRDMFLNPDKAKQMGARSRFVIKEYYPSEVKQQLDVLYKELMIN